jgi:hypothetical protein
MACRVTFEVDEGRTVRDDVLHVLHIRNIKARIESLADDPLRDGEPYLAIGRGGRADSKLVSRCP